MLVSVKGCPRPHLRIRVIEWRYDDSNGISVMIVVGKGRGEKEFVITRYGALLINIELTDYDSKEHHQAVWRFKRFMKRMGNQYGSSVAAVNKLIESGIFNTLTECGEPDEEIYYETLFNNMQIIVDTFSFSRTKSAR